MKIKVSLSVAVLVCLAMSGCEPDDSSSRWDQGGEANRVVDYRENPYTAQIPVTSEQKNILRESILRMEKEPQEEAVSLSGDEALLLKLEVLSQTPEREKVDGIKNRQSLFSLDGSVRYVLFRLDPTGYAIYDLKNHSVRESSVDGDHEYYTDPQQKYYYNGTMEYFVEEEGGFRELILGRFFSAEEALQLKAGRDEFEKSYPQEKTTLSLADLAFEEDLDREGKDDSLGIRGDAQFQIWYGTRLYNCNNEETMDEFFPGPTVPKDAGVCGPLAAAVIGAYYDDHIPGYGDFVQDWRKLSGAGTHHRYGIDLVKHMKEDIQPGNTFQSTAYYVSNGYKSYMRRRGIDAGMNVVLAGIGDIYETAKAKMNRHIPTVAGFYWFEKKQGHYMITIGYENLSQKKFKVNDGWGDTRWVTMDGVISCRVPLVLFHSIFDCSFRNFIRQSF